MKRTDVTFRSGDAEIHAWLYVPEGRTTPGPAVVLGHGLGAIKAMGLDNYASRFAEEGYVAVAFDYRGFGESGGEPRQVLDIAMQLEDWKAAVEYTRGLEYVDPEQVALFGSSFGGGHVITTASRDPRIAAVIAQCPFTSGVASAFTIRPRTLPRVMARAVRDVVGRNTRVALAAAPDQPALMNAPDAEPGYLALVPEGVHFVNEVHARVALRVPLYHPGRKAKRVTAPILLQVCEPDSVAPDGPTKRWAAKAPRGEVKTYDAGHFAIYRSPHLEVALNDQVEFLKRHVPVT